MALTTPWTVLVPDQARWVQLALSVLALLGAWALVLRLLQLPMQSVLAPVFLLAGFYCGPVTDPLLTGDLGAFVLLALDSITLTSSVGLRFGAVDAHAIAAARRSEATAWPEGPGGLAGPWRREQYGGALWAELELAAHLCMPWRGQQ